MTRINVVPEQELTPEHLSGEFHEITRPFTLVREAVAKGKSPGDYIYPEDYKLGRGHVTFFYNRLQYISTRYLKLGMELRYRALKSGRPSSCNLQMVLKVIADARRDIPEEWWGDYTPTDNAITINRERIRERLDD